MSSILTATEPAGATAACSSSGGKDSLLALWHARRNGVHVTTLLTMFDETGTRTRSHGISRELMQKQADALGVALVGPSADWSSYEPVFLGALRELHAQGLRIAVFGDIDLQPHREWEERVCAQVGFTACLPLWGRDRRELAEEALALGLRAIVVCTDSRRLGDEYCGRPFDAEFIASLPPDVDPCGENGEFHTFVYDGPMFRYPLDVRVTGRQVSVSRPELGGIRYCFATLESS